VLGMPPGRSRGGFRRFGGFRRRTPQRLEWVAFSLEALLTVGTNARATIVSQAFVATMTRPTIERIRGTWLIYMEEGQAQFDFMNLFMGITVQPSATTAATSEVPLTSGNSNRWMWWQVVPMQESQGAATAGNLSPATTAQRFAFDVRSRRRMSELDQLSLMLEPNGNAGTTARILGGGRVLLRETRG